MQQVKRAATYRERPLDWQTAKRDPEHRDRQLAKWLSEGVRLGIPYRSLATAANLDHPETVRRIVERFREGPPRF